MAYLKRPQKGDKVLQSLFDSVNSIIDYLPTITVRGDNYSTFVEHSTAGTVIHAKQPYDTDQTGGRRYYAGSGLYLSGNTFYNALSGDFDVYGSGGITIVDNVISCLFKPSGVASGNYTSGRFITLGEEDQGQTPINCTLSGVGTIAANLHQVEAGMLDVQPNYYIKIDETITSGYNLISCDLTHLTQLYNYDLVTDAQVDQGSGIMDHHVELRDFFLNETTGHKGLGTEVKFFKHSIGNIDPSGNLVNPIVGLKVDCTITGGRFISTSAVPRYYYPNTETYPLDPEDLQINLNLSGFHGIQIGDPNDIYCPSSKWNQIYLADDFYQDLDDIVSHKGPDYDVEKVLTYIPSSENSRAYLDWKVLPSSESNLSTVFPLLEQGDNIQLQKLDNGKTRISCSGVTGGGGCPWPNYANLYNDASTTVSVQTNYTAGAGGGWLRVSYKGQPIPGCYGVTIDGKLMGLYTVGNNMTTDMMGCSWLLPIPPYNTFVVNFPSQCTFAYFDGEKYDTSQIEAMYEDIISATTSAAQERDEAFYAYGQAKNRADDAENDYVNYVEQDKIYGVEWYLDKWNEASEYAVSADNYAANASGAADEAAWQYSLLIMNDLDILHRAIDYKTSAINYANAAADYATSAHTEAERAHQYYLSAVDYWNNHQ